MIERRLNLAVTLLFIGFAATLSPALAQDERGGYPDPARFEEEIASFKAADARAMPPEGAVLFTGSSSIRLWHEDLAEDMAPLTVAGRGFGGSTMYGLLYYADRIILPYKPRAIVINEGDNDIKEGVEAEQVVETFGALVAKVHAALPDCRIYMLSIKPSWALWPVMSGVNRSLAELCEADDRLVYVDLATPLMGKDQMPVAELFKEDQLHLNREGSIVWRDALGPILRDAEWVHEVGRE